MCFESSEQRDRLEVGEVSQKKTCKMSRERKDNQVRIVPRRGTHRWEGWRAESERVLSQKMKGNLMLSVFLSLPSEWEGIIKDGWEWGGPNTQSCYDPEGSRSPLIGVKPRRPLVRFVSFHCRMKGARMLKDQRASLFPLLLSPRSEQPVTGSSQGEPRSSWMTASGYFQGGSHTEWEVGLTNICGPF